MVILMHRIINKWKLFYSITIKLWTLQLIKFFFNSNIDDTALTKCHIVTGKNDYKAHFGACVCDAMQNELFLWILAFTCIFPISKVPYVEYSKLLNITFSAIISITRINIVWLASWPLDRFHVNFQRSSNRNIKFECRMQNHLKEPMNIWFYLHRARMGSFKYLCSNDQQKQLKTIAGGCDSFSALLITINFNVNQIWEN